MVNKPQGGVPTDIDFINLNDISSGQDLIPEDQYHVKFMEGEVRENNAKDGYYVNYRVVVQSGEFSGHSVFSMWSLKPNAVWKMNKDFKAIGYAPPNGVPHLADLLGFEGIVEIQIEKGKKRPNATSEDDKYPDKNSIKRWVGPLK